MSELTTQYYIQCNNMANVIAFVVFTFTGRCSRRGIFVIYGASQLCDTNIFVRNCW